MVYYDDPLFNTLLDKTCNHQNLDLHKNPKVTMDPYTFISFITKLRIVIPPKILKMPGDEGNICLSKQYVNLLF